MSDRQPSSCGIIAQREGVSAGVANIMAYSWPSHCKRYLDAIEAEKRYLRSQQVCCGHLLWSLERNAGGTQLCTRTSTCTHASAGILICRQPRS